MAGKSADKELRIVVLGKAGNETDALINTIPGEKSTTKYDGSEFSVIKGEFEDKPVAFINTPGLLRTGLTDKKLKEELMKCILHAAPGPHVFLYVKEAKPFTSEEEKALKNLEGTFEKSKPFFLGVVMSDEDISDEDHDIIRDMFEGFSGYVTVNTEDPNVSELMKKIKEMAEKQGYYSNELCEKAEELSKSGKPVEEFFNCFISGFTGEAFSGPLMKVIGELATLLDKAIQRWS